MRCVGFEDKSLIKRKGTSIPDASFAIQGCDMASGDTPAHPLQRIGSDQLQFHLSTGQKPITRLDEGATTGQINDMDGPTGEQTSAGDSVARTMRRAQPRTPFPATSYSHRAFASIGTGTRWIGGKYTRAAAQGPLHR